MLLNCHLHSCNQETCRDETIRREGHHITYLFSHSAAAKSGLLAFQNCDFRLPDSPGNKKSKERPKCIPPPPPLRPAPSVLLSGDCVRDAKAAVKSAIKISSRELEQSECIAPKGTKRGLRLMMSTKFLDF